MLSQANQELEPLVGGALPSTYKDVFFDATLKYNESHQIYRPSVEPDYVGRPTPSMDKAWDELIGCASVPYHFLVQYG